MNTIKISYKIEGINYFDATAPKEIESTIEYTLPEKDSLNGVKDGLPKAFAEFISHPAVAELVKVFENASVSIAATGAEKQTLPVGKQLKQLFRLAQAKLGV